MNLLPTHSRIGKLTRKRSKFAPTHSKTGRRRANMSKVISNVPAVVSLGKCMVHKGRYLCGARCVARKGNCIHRIPANLQHANNAIVRDSLLHKVCYSGNLLIELKMGATGQQFLFLDMTTRIIALSRRHDLNKSLERIEALSGPQFFKRKLYLTATFVIQFTKINGVTGQQFL